MSSTILPSTSPLRVSFRRGGSLRDFRIGARHTLQNIASLGHSAAICPMPLQLKDFCFLTLPLPIRGVPGSMTFVGRTVASLMLITWSFSFDRCTLMELLPRLSAPTVLSSWPAHNCQPVDQPLYWSWVFAPNPHSHFRW